MVTTSRRVRARSSATGRRRGTTGRNPYRTPKRTPKSYRRIPSRRRSVSLASTVPLSTNGRRSGSRARMRTGSFFGNTARSFGAAIADSATGFPIGTALNNAYRQTYLGRNNRATSGQTSDSFASLPTHGDFVKDPKFSTLGASRTREVFGNLTDASCCYAGFSSLVPSDVLIVSWAGVLRSLLRKAKIVIPDMNRPLKEYLYALTPGIYTNFDLFRAYINVIFQEYNATTGVYNDAPISVEILSTHTLLSLASEAAFQNAFNVVSSITGNFENRRYIRVNLAFLPADEGAIITNNYPLVLASLDLDDCTIHLGTSAKVAIQNRSVNREGEDDVEAIDAVPVMGKYYDLSNIYPVTNTQEATLNGLRVDTGVLLTRSSEMSTDGFKLPPPSGYFKNCIKSGSLQFTPGTIMKFTVCHNTSVKGWNKFLLSYSRQSTSIASTGVTRHTNLGKMRLVALEKAMRTTSAQPISLFYESQIKMASYSISQTHSSMITDHELTEFNKA